ncbi:MAG: hypothetical protein SLAVMIC_00286 [uncultured marine phage]|uniref:Uncharacterized protein n=1 Tax=uncultured marine phage TaxID=707152 RepID=A0A8D9CBU2_9VIRU|nr:MAG: hypothetical protein SLAVMIC_00286 [uncultured marine phage]
MKYINNYKNHRHSQKVEFLNEEFIGKALKGLFKSAVSKMAVNLSKQIGSAKEIDKLVDQYQQQLEKLGSDKMAKMKALIELEKSRLEGAEIEESAVKKVKVEYDKSLENFDKQKDNLKKKFDLQFKKILDRESDENVKEYIQLKKIDMVQEMLEKEMTQISEDMGVSDEDVKNSKILADLMNGKKEEAETMKKLQAKTEANLAKGKEEGGREFKAGDEITYFMGEDEGKKDPKQAKVSEEQVDKDGNPLKDETKIRVSTENTPNGFVIDKGQIQEEEKEEEKPAEGEEETKV